MVRLLTTGWQVNGLFTIQSGAPLNVQTGTDQLLSGTPQQRPNLTGEWRLPSDRSQGDQAWFNRLAFAVPLAGTLGNLGRDVLVGPGASVMNLALFREFTVRERVRLQFRSEFFNTLNHTNLGNPNANLNAGVRTGTITSAGEPRIIQFALKVRF